MEKTWQIEIIVNFSGVMSRTKTKSSIGAIKNEKWYFDCSG